jgi:hypothetical protein
MPGLSPERSPRQRIFSSWRAWKENVALRLRGDLLNLRKPSSAGVSEGWVFW